MSEHIAEIFWKRQTAGFSYDEYNRTHHWRFDNGVTLDAAAAPEFLGDPTCIDPEEAFVASISSCHMLTFLAIAARRRLVVDAYEDKAVGHMEKNQSGRLAVTRVDLHPVITFAEGVQVDAAALETLHHTAHEQCFIANSVTTDITVHQ